MNEWPADQLIRGLVAWGTQKESVRAMLLTSTRAMPGAAIDRWSDYDVILVMPDIHPFVTDRSWVDAFGDVLIAYWDPVTRDDETGAPCSGNIIQYVDGLKIDFTLWPVAHLNAIVSNGLTQELDAGYQVLLDKDGLTDHLPSPSFTGYKLSPPDETTYLTLVNDFFVGVPYVAKCLLRDELLPARWVLDYDMRYVYLLPMLEWWAASEQGWRFSPGINGKGLKRHLPPDRWSELEATFAGAGIDETWNALFRMITLFRHAATDVGERLGFTYPVDLEARLLRFVVKMRAAGRAGRDS